MALADTVSLVLMTALLICLLAFLLLHGVA